MSISAQATDHLAAAPAPRTPGQWRIWVRRLLYAVGATLLALVLLAAVTIGPLLLEPNRYEGTPSIKLRPDYRDTALMRRAWSLPAAQAYRRGGFEYQRNPSFCGPASVANVLRSLGARADQGRVIDGTRYEPWFGILVGGLTLDELADLLRHRLGRPVQVVRDPTLVQFRALLRRANDPSVRVIANFHRGPLFGRGHGHFSPILGYLEREDLVLVGDVNDDYRPFLVSSERLWRATDTIDRETGRERGLLVTGVAA